MHSTLRAETIPGSLSVRLLCPGCSASHCTHSWPNLGGITVDQVPDTCHWGAAAKQTFENTVACRGRQLFSSRTVVEVTKHASLPITSLDFSTGSICIWGVNHIMDHLDAPAVQLPVVPITISTCSLFRMRVSCPEHALISLQQCQNGHFGNCMRS